MSTLPLELTLRAPKPQFIAGEGVTLSLEQRAHADLELESVDLNQSRTTIELTMTGPDGHSTRRSLSGADHCALHHVSTFQGLGQRFSVSAGDRWESTLELLSFSRPLSVGHYRVELTYRYGDEPDQQVRSNAVSFEVVPSTVDAVGFRWFGTSDPRDEHVALWSTSTGQSPGWWLHRATGFDPGVLRTSAAMGPEPARPEPPSIAHLNDITHMHFSRWLCWLDGSALAAQSVQPHGRIGTPQASPHGLSDAVLADPPLHRRDEGLTAVIVGRDAAGPQARVVHAGPNAAPERAHPLPTPPPEHALVAWAASEDPPAGALCWIDQNASAWSVHALDIESGASQVLHRSDEPIIELLVDQWLGTGRLLAIGRRGTRLELTTWTLEALAAGPERSELLIEPDPAWSGPHQIVPTSAGTSVVMMFEEPQRWIVWSANEVGTIDKARLVGTAMPTLVVTRKGHAFLIEHDSSRGFIAHSVL